MRTRTMYLLLAAVMVLSLAGCKAKTESTSEVTDDTAKSARTVLEEIMQANTKTGTYKLTTEFASGDVSEQTAEFWVDEGLFRIDYFLEDGTRRISILTDDGITAYFAMDDEEACEPAVATVQHYLDIFTLPEGELEDLGADKATGAEMLRIVIQETEYVEGSANAWYTEDATYYVKGDSLLKLVRRGAVPEDDGTIPDLQTATMEFTSFESGTEIDPTLFVLPYPVRDAD